MSGTGQAKVAKVILKSKRVVNVKSYNERYNPNAEGHSDISSDKVLWHSTGLKEWTVDIEVEIEPGMEPLRPEEIDENNPADLLIIAPGENRRYVQGITTDVGTSFREKETEKLTFTLGHFKDMVPE